VFDAGLQGASTMDLLELFGLGALFFGLPMCTVFSVDGSYKSIERVNKNTLER
jgi:hypothetical protein